MKRSPLKRSKPLKAGGALKRSAIAKGATAEAKDLTQSRKVVNLRSGGVCELRLSGCARVASSVHHRKRRSQGNDHRAVNLLHLCVYCDHAVHASPARAYANGWMVRSFELPENIPVVLEDGTVLL